MDRTSKRILESIVRMDIMPCSHCAMTKECDIYSSTSKQERTDLRSLSGGMTTYYPSLCLRHRWYRFLKEQNKGMIYDIQIT